jgi:hypothetical protein
MKLLILSFHQWPPNKNDETFENVGNRTRDLLTKITSALTTAPLKLIFGFIVNTLPSANGYPTA